MRLREAEFNILQCLRDNQVFANTRGDVHLLLSGGKDSVALLELLTSLTHLQPSWSKLDLRLFLHHFNHKRRGLDSDLDEEHCIDLARRTGHPIETYSWTAELEEELTQGINFHELARRWRYTTVKNFAQTHSQNRDWVIATAHHRRDHAESVLLNLARGCSTGGLIGMEPWNPTSKLLRPFLWLESALSDAFISEKNLSHREDDSNQKTDYSRNKIRHNVIPHMTEVNSKFIEHVWLLSRDLQAQCASTQPATVSMAAKNSGIRTDAIHSMDDLQSFITKSTQPHSHFLTRSKLSNVLVHVQKARANPKAAFRYNFALSEQFEIIITAELIEIKAHS